MGLLMLHTASQLHGTPRTWASIFTLETVLWLGAEWISLPRASDTMEFFSLENASFLWLLIESLPWDGGFLEYLYFADSLVMWLCTQVLGGLSDLADGRASSLCG